jgi:hypothetical protein
MRKVLSQSSQCDLASDSDERRFDEQCGGTSRIIDLLSHKEELVGGNNNKKECFLSTNSLFQGGRLFGIGTENRTKQKWKNHKFIHRIGHCVVDSVQFVGSSKR